MRIYFGQLPYVVSYNSINTHLPMFLAIWALKIVSDWHMIPLSTASWNFSSKDWSRCCSFFIRFCGRMACMILQTHMTPPRRMAPSLTKSCGIMDRMTIQIPDAIACWYSCRVENMTGGGKSSRVVSLSGTSKKEKWELIKLKFGFRASFNTTNEG